MSPAAWVDLLVITIRVGAVLMLCWGCLLCIGVLGRPRRPQRPQAESTDTHLPRPKLIHWNR